MNLSVNETNIEGLDGIPNIDHVERVVDGRDPSTDCSPLDEVRLRPVPPPLLSRQGPNLLGEIGVPNGSSLYEIIPSFRENTIILSDSSHFITKRKIANTAIRRKSSGSVSALVEVAKASGEAIATQMKKNGKRNRIQ